MPRVATVLNMNCGPVRHLSSLERLALICKCSGRQLLVLAALSLSFWTGSASAQDNWRFAENVKFRPLSLLLRIAGSEGILDTTVTIDNRIVMRLANVTPGETSDRLELHTTVDRSDLSLIESKIQDLVKDVPIRTMKRKVGKSMLDNKDTDVFEYTEIKDNTVTTTEPYIEFKVADFVSAILLATDAVHRKDKQPINLSMLSGRSVTRVVLVIEGEEKVNGRQATRVRVTPPNDTAGGVRYLIAWSDQGYYPALIRARSKDGNLIELEGVPQKKK